MKKTLKQCVGIDISKETFTACVCSLRIDQTLDFSEIKSFDNNQTGFNQLVRWANKLLAESVELVYLMEATGVYYEQLAYHLHKIKKTVHVVLPNKAKHFLGSLNLKTKSDNADSKALSQFGVERKFESWNPPKPIYKKLKELSRFRTSLKEDRTIFMNRLSSIKASQDGSSYIIDSLNDIIKNIDNQIKKCEEEILSVLKEEKELNNRINNVATIKGIGIFSVVSIVAETDGFKLIKSSKQLTSFAGLDVVERQSGTSLKGKTRISKKGNSHIRRTLYFPALVAARHNELLKCQYIRILEKGNPKMVASVAIQRKLLTLVYALWKNNLPYDIDYNTNKYSIKAEAPL